MRSARNRRGWLILGMYYSALGDFDLSSSLVVHASIMIAIILSISCAIWRFAVMLNIGACSKIDLPISTDTLLHIIKDCYHQDYVWKKKSV